MRDMKAETGSQVTAAQDQTINQMSCNEGNENRHSNAD